MTRAVRTLYVDRDRDMVRDWIATAPRGSRVEVKGPTRTTPQNARLWEMLTCVSLQVEWYGERLTSDEWKDMFTASVRKSRVVPGLEGGFVVLGQRTSDMSKAEMSELFELIEAFAAERGVVFPWHEREV